MNSIAIKFNIENLHKIIFSVLILYVVSVGILYLVGLNRLILNVVARERMEQLISINSAEISGLESDYLSINKKLDKELAREIGLIQSLDKVHFVYRQPDTPGLSLSLSK